MTEMEFDKDAINEEEQIPLKRKWSNRERVLVISSRGITFRNRHLMNDLKTLLPHSKGDSKVDKKEKVVCLNEVAEMRNCSKCIYFESRKKDDLYMWMANVDGGPSAKFLVHNVHTSGELKLSGNCLKASRPVLSFEKTFDQYPHYQVIKELLTQIFATPNHHPRSQPFVDHIFNFSIEDKRIWFRNYQIVDEESKKLEEIGPRMVLQPIKIFEGSFGGPIIYENADYVCPNAIRKNRKHSTANKYVDKVRSKTHLLERRAKEPITYKSDPIFDAVYGKDGEQGKKNSADEKSSETIRKSMVEVGRLKRQIESIRYSKKSKKPKL